MHVTHFMAKSDSETALKIGQYPMKLCTVWRKFKAYLYRTMEVVQAAKRDIAKMSVRPYSL